MVRICPPSPVEKPEETRAPAADELDRRLVSQAEELVAYARNPRAGDLEMTFKQFEQSIILRVFDIGATAEALFLACCETRIRARTPRSLVLGGRSFERKSPTDRSIMTWFGSVRYWRTYMLDRDAPQGGHGFFPLDQELGLTSDRFGFNMLDVVVRLATTLSFATAKSTAELFLPEVPATEVIEHASSGESALAISLEFKEKIDLLLTDVVLPILNGAELQQALLRNRPELPVLYMSGHIDDRIEVHGVLGDEATFIQKPFRSEEILRKVRAVLDGERL